MIPVFRGCFPFGSDLNVSALRSRSFSSSKLLILASATMMSSLLPSTILAQTPVVAKPPVSPEVLAVHALAKRPVPTPPENILAATSGSGASTGFNSEQGFGGTARQNPGPGCDLFPAPPSTGAAVGLPYFGPSPSTVNPSFVGPVLLLSAASKVDAIHGTVTLPLYKGKVKSTGKTAWYILTDVSDQGIAQELGLNFSAKLGFAENAARTATIDHTTGTFIFDKGTVDFSPKRDIVPGPTGQEFPPKSFAPGEVGDNNYSPYVTITDAGNVVYNAPMIAYNVDANEINFPNGNVDYSKVHDAVAAIDPINMTVTLHLVNGFSFGRPVWYISMDASIPLAAAIEHNTYAPLMAKLLLGFDDSSNSPIERIFIATNGAENGSCNNPQRQGLSADFADGFRPNNTLGGIPTIALDYSPAWDANLYTWTNEAISKGYRQQLREEFQILTYAQDGLITGASADKPFGSAGFSINCPIVQRLD